MLSNSSLALEILVHDNHQHGEEMQMHAMSHEHGDMHSFSIDQNMDTNHSNEDCLCDDICCVSSAENSSIEMSVDTFNLKDDSQKLRNLYQSIELDLLLPPPNLS